MAYNLLGSRYTYYVDSGTSSPSGFDIRGWGKAYYDQTATDLANNQSRVKLEFGVTIKGSWYGKYKVTGTIYKKVDSSWTTLATNTYTSSEGTQSAGTYTRGTLTDKIIPHDNIGTGQVRVDVTVQGISGVVGTKNYRYTYDLPQIAQQTQASDLSLIVGQSSTYTISPMSNTYTHSLKISFKNHTYYVGENGELTNTEYIFAGSTINVECPTSFYDFFTTASDSSGSVTLKTYNGETQVGQETTGSLTVAAGSACAPRITSSSITDINNTTVALTGNNRVLIPYYSHARINITFRASATADTGTTILEKRIDNVIFDGNYYDPPNIKQYYEVQVTNSRRITTHATLNSASVLNYTKVAINTANPYRTSPTANNMRISFTGTYWNSNFGAANNTLSVQWSVREKGSSTYTFGGTFTQGTDYTITNNTFSGSNIQLTCPLTGGWKYNKAYDFLIEATDELGTYPYYKSVNKGEPIYYWYEDNDHNYFKVNGTLLATDLKIGSGGLLDLIYPIGSIYTTTDGTFNPNTTFGGTWQQIKDVFLLAAGNTYAGGTTGGSADLQAHTHTMSADFYIRHGNTNNTDTVAAGTNTTITNGAYSSTWGNGIYTSSYSHKPDKVAISGDTGSTGAGNQGNMPPYLTVYVWKRTA